MMFEHVPRSQTHKIRTAKELDYWPNDQTFYLDIAREIFPEVLSEDLQTDEAFDVRQRATNLLGEFLIRDGRAFEAIIFIAKLASESNMFYNSNSCNALAHLYVYLVHKNGEIPIDDNDLLVVLEPLCQVRDTQTNAMALYRFLLNRIGPPKGT